MSNDMLRNFEEFGRAIARSDTPTLRFGDDGKYRLDDREIDLKGLELIAQVPELRHGWVRWDSGFPVKEIMGRVSEGFQPPGREELGDTDKALWETSKDGVPQDPWRRTRDIIVEVEDDHYADNGHSDYFRFVIDRDYYAVCERNSGPDGAEGLGILALVYAARWRAGAPYQLPLIELTHSSFTAGHVNKLVTYHVPQINVLGWHPQLMDVEASHKAAATQKVVKLPAKRRAAK
jgi:hypothetical protein